jgi:hypothetical protein
MLDQLKQQKSPLSSTAKIQVTTLDQVVNSLLKENGAAISEITFVPSREAINYVMQQQQSAPNSKTTPQPAKAAPNTPTKK